MSSRTSNLSEMLAEHRAGDESVVDRIVPIVYDELRAMAARFLRAERPNHTLQTTDLVHEAYLRLVGQQRVEWKNRAHFYAIASQVIRRLLVDHARSRVRLKRGAGAVHVPLDEASSAMADGGVDLEALDDALRLLETFDPQQSRIVELRYFGGLSIDETAAVLGVSGMTVKRGWRLARAWLHRELSRDERV